MITIDQAHKNRIESQTELLKVLANPVRICLMEKLIDVGEALWQTLLHVFTGKLEKMVKKNAMQKVVNLGGILDNNVIKSPNYLILGNNDYNAILKGKNHQSIKSWKVEIKGQDIEIIDEFTFYNLI